MMLEKEYAFSLLYKNKKKINVAFYKGMWLLAKKEKEMMTDRIDFSDALTVEESKNDLAKGLLESFIKLHSKKIDYGDERKLEAAILNSFFEIWGGPYSQLESITVYQPGRNSFLEDNGEITLSPRKEEWKV